MKTRISHWMERLHRRGQVMVLSCVTMLILALMIAAGFSMSNAIHERIRLQSHADAAAYSAAIVSARAMNVTAYTNRTIAAVLVAQMSVHAWMAIASQTVSIHLAGAANFARMAACEMDNQHCCSIRCWGVCCNVPHCIHAALDGIIAVMHGIKALQYWSKVTGKESDFNDAVEALNKATIDLHKLQKDALKAAANEISSEGGVLSQLKQRNAPRSQYVTQVLNHNKGEFSCALEGTDMDGDCKKVVGSTPSKSGQDVRSKAMQSAANAARLMFHVLCSDCQESADEDFQDGSDHLMNTQWGDEEETHDFTVMSSVSSGTIPSTGPAEAKAVGALSFGSMSNEKFCSNCRQNNFPLISMAWSNDGSGLHLIPHQGSHNKFKGYQRQDVCGDEACFVNFRSNSDSNNDFNQPSMYAAVSQNLGTMRGGQRGKWEINNDATINLAMGDESTKLVLKPRGTGYAVAKAKVYYHDFNSWKHPPNLFDPFWRAKLHPFKRDDFRKIVQDSGDPSGGSIAGQVPVEGAE